MAPLNVRIEITGIYRMSRSLPADFDSIANAKMLCEDELSRVLWYQMTRATKEAMVHFEERVGRPLELGAMEFTVLALVSENPGVTGGQLARSGAITAPNVTRCLKALEKRGFLRRESSETDHREINVYATSKGACISRQAIDVLSKGELEVFGSLSWGERVLLGELLRKMATHSRSTRR